jgi:hypothetical protein
LLAEALTEAVSVEFALTAGASGCAGSGHCAGRRAAARLDPSDGHALREHDQAGCASGPTTAARSRDRGSRALASFTLRVNDERAWAF